MSRRGLVMLVLFAGLLAATPATAAPTASADAPWEGVVEAIRSLWGDLVVALGATGPEAQSGQNPEPDPEDEFGSAAEPNG